MLVAGEASGDQHAAHMFLEMKTHCPELRGFGMGGEKMRRAGIDIRFDSSDIAVIGVIEVIKHYREIKQALRQMQQLLVQERPDLLVCVDYKEFNFKLAKFAKQQGIRVLFYVSPQVWAWRPGRVKKYGQVIDMMAVIFPFETAFYKAEKIPVSYVGHPSVDKVHPGFSRTEDFKRYQLPGGKAVVGLLPGSRKNEIQRLLPVMLQAAQLLSRRYPEVHFLLPQADPVSDELLQSYLSRSTVSIQVIKHQPYDVIQCCDVVMTASGTVTLEIALLNVPMVICYKLSAITYYLARLLVKTPFIGLPNIIAGQGIVRELIQHDASAEKLAEEVLQILNDKSYAQTIRDALLRVREALGQGGASKNMAELALIMLRGTPA